MNMWTNSSRTKTDHPLHRRPLAPKKQVRRGRGGKSLLSETMTPQDIPSGQDAPPQEQKPEEAPPQPTRKRMGRGAANEEPPTSAPPVQRPTGRVRRGSAGAEAPSHQHHQQRL